MGISPDELWVLASSFFSFLFFSGEARGGWMVEDKGFIAKVSNHSIRGARVRDFVKVPRACVRVLRPKFK